MPISIFNRNLIRGPIEIGLDKGVFCKVWSERAKDCAHDLEVTVSGNFHNLVYRDGTFWGIVRPMGGSFYPFSKDQKLEKPSSRADKKDHTNIAVVCITAGAHLKVRWGISEKLIRNKNGKNYYYNANGTFFVEIDPKDAAKNANTFYHKLCVQNNTNEVTDAALRDELKDAFESSIAFVIQKMLLEMDGSLDSFINVMASEALELSAKVYEEVKDLFEEYGLTIAKTASVRSIVQNVGVREI